MLPSYAKCDPEVQDDVCGRVNAMFNVIALLLTPVAQIRAGVVSDRFGPSTFYGWSGLALFIGLVAMVSRP